MTHAIAHELLKAVARADFRRWVDETIIGYSLKPKWKRECYWLGLYAPSFAEYEAALGRRHPNDPRPLAGGMGCIA
jgi:hypothetical protein